MKIIALVLALTLLGCGGGLFTFLANVIADAAEAASVIDQIDAFQKRAFDKRPDTVKQAHVEQLIFRARAAVQLMDRAARAGTDLKQGEVASAKEDFAEAYAELVKLLSPLGLAEHRPGSLEPLGARPDGGLVVQRPMMLSQAVAPRPRPGLDPGRDDAQSCELVQRKAYGVVIDDAVNHSDLVLDPGKYGVVIHAPVFVDASQATR